MRASIDTLIGRILVVALLGAGAPAASATNLLVNGNFSAGNSGFGTGYVYSPGAGNGTVAGSYTVDVNTNPWHPAFTPFGDHTSGAGQMMVVNGATVSQIVWSQTVAVSSGTDYSICFWAATAFPSSPGYLRLRINGGQVGSTLVLPSQAGAWVQFSAVWNSGLNTMATIVIDDLNTVDSGNDFVLDDLNFSAGAASCPSFLTIVDSIPGAFIDISASGTVLNLNDDDEAIINTTVGNAVFPAGTVAVANNGGLAFPSVGGQDDLDPNNAPIPSNSAFNGRQSALAYWDDLKGDDLAAAGADAPRGGKNGSVRWQEISNVLIVQWTDRPVGGALRVNDTVRFQVQIFGGVSVGPGAQYAQFIYDDIDQAVPNGGASATIGHQGGASGFSDYQWSFNTAGAVSNGTALTVITPMATTNTNAVPAVSDVGQVVLVLLFLTAGVFVFRRGRKATA
ncbi:MAG TPA: hypothetical protein VJZ71_01760 [Phycisphaerae bacterium]|nr:hypothetical protein [Phycisphaerae bacterium]